MKGSRKASPRSGVTPGPATPAQPAALPGSGAPKGAEATPNPRPAESPPPVPTMEAGPPGSLPPPNTGQQPPAGPPVSPVLPAALDPDDPANKTLGEIFGVNPSPPGTGRPPPPGFAMQDDPFDDPRLTRPLAGVREPDPAPGPRPAAPHPAPPPAFPRSDDPYDPVKHAPPDYLPPASPRLSTTGQQAAADRAWRPPAINSPQELMPPGAVRYESRIKVLEAFRYTGSFKGAPEWVDRNWLAYGQWDPLRGIEPGPALNVPCSSGVVAMARIGDYVVQQEFIVPNAADDGVDRTVIQLEVWSSDAFERTFMPVLVRSSRQPSSGAVEDAEIAA